MSAHYLLPSVLNLASSVERFILPVQEITSSVERIDQSVQDVALSVERFVPSVQEFVRSVERVARGLAYFGEWGHNFRESHNEPTDRHPKFVVSDPPTESFPRFHHKQQRRISYGTTCQK